MSNYVPVTLEGIEEGVFKKALDKAISDASIDLVSHVREFGADETKGAKSVVTMKVTISSLGDYGDLEMFDVAGELSVKSPARPKRHTQAVSGEDDHGRQTVVCKPTGTNADNVHQGQLYPPQPSEETADKPVGKPEETT